MPGCYINRLYSCNNCWPRKIDFNCRSRFFTHLINGHGIFEQIVQMIAQILHIATHKPKAGIVNGF